MYRLFSYVLLLFILFHIQVIYAQKTDTLGMETMKNRVILFFNNKQADSLYSLTGAAFRKAVPEKQFIDISQNQLFRLGKISKAELDTIRQGVAKYRAALDAGLYSIFISLDTTGRLETFLIRPYKQELKGDVPRTITDNPMQSTLDKKVDSIIQRWMYSDKIVGLSMGLMKDGNFYYYNYGETKKGNKTLPDSLSIYEIGSITKTFTGLLLAKAVINKKIRLDDDVNKYLPKEIPILQQGGDTIKVVHLANHTSGLPRIPAAILVSDKNNPYKDFDNKQLYASLQNIKPENKPGTTYAYSNLGVGLLGVILENIYKMPYEKMVKQFICDKAGMKYTTQTIDEKLKSLFVQGYNADIQPNSLWGFKALSGAGCIRSNVRDMLLYAKRNTAGQTHLNFNKNSHFGLFVYDYCYQN